MACVSGLSGVVERIGRHLFRSGLPGQTQPAGAIGRGDHLRSSPLFRSFHGAALTESVSASILLISLGIAIRALDRRLSLRASLGLLLLLSILAAQFRPYLGLVGVLSAALIVFQRGKPWRIPLFGITALAFVAGTLAFPVYRAALGIGFFLPNVSALMLTHVSYVAWDLDKETAQSLNTVVLNDEIRARLIGREPSATPTPIVSSMIWSQRGCPPPRPGKKLAPPRGACGRRRSGSSSGSCSFRWRQSDSSMPLYAASRTVSSPAT